MKSEIDALMQARDMDAILVFGNAEHNPPMCYLTGGGHVSHATLIKKRGSDATLFFGDMERDEAAKSGLKLIPYSTYDFEEIFKKEALRDAGMVYNCMDLAGGARTNCQATLAQPYQQKGLLQDAMKSAAGRLSQIQSLMRQINATTDQKAVQEIQARIGAEKALLAHEMSQVQMLQGMADSEERIARSRERERQYQMLVRTGKVADYLP